MNVLLSELRKKLDGVDKDEAIREALELIMNAEEKKPNAEQLKIMEAGNILHKLKYWAKDKNGDVWATVTRPVKDVNRWQSGCCGAVLLNRDVDMGFLEWEDVEAYEYQE